MTTASRSLATALWRARFASGLLRPRYTTNWDTTRDPSRTALATAQAQVAMAKAGVLSGKLVDVKEMEAEAVAEWRKLRGLLLAIPTRVANQAVGLKRPTSC